MFGICVLALRNDNGSNHVLCYSKIDSAHVQYKTCQITIHNI